VKFREIFRFEFAYQARLVRTWLYFAVLFVIAFLLMRTAGGGAGGFINSPFDIAQLTVLTSVFWILMAPTVAGSAAARDVRTRMHPFVYTAPISKAEYLGGRFLAAFVLNALFLLAIQLGILAALLVPGLSPEIVAPFRLSVYLSSYGVLALPTAFIVTAIQFSLAALNRRAIVSYLGSVFLLVIVSVSGSVSINVLQMQTLGKMLDPLAGSTIIGPLSEAWTPLEKSTVLIGLQGWMIANRLLWIGIAMAILAFTHLRFRFDHRAG
jgi:ABC-type transport system involved in multi-copper enzyme maturation permease subunit